MIRTLTAFVLGLVVIVLASAPAVAQKKKKDAPKGEKVTLEGTLTCPKCDLGESDKCATVLLVGKDKKQYLFDAASNKKYHSEICKAAKQAKVEGTVKKDGDKMIISVTKLEFKK